MKKILVMLLTIVMIIMTIGTTAFAAETNYNAEIQENILEVNTSRSRQIVPGDARLSFYPAISGQHFSCSSGNISIRINFTPNDGGTILAVRLKDVTTGTTVREWQSSNGYIQSSISLSQGHTYYFEYLCAYGNRTITVYNTSFES